MRPHLVEGGDTQCLGDEHGKRQARVNGSIVIKGVEIRAIKK